jgi:hypothetical protein
MYSCHATSTTQEALDALIVIYPPCQLVMTSVSAKSTPSPTGPKTQDIPLPDAPSTAPRETEGWKTVEGKATQRKKQKVAADKIRIQEVNDKPPTTKNGGWGKKSHQPTNKNTSPKKT